MLKTEECETLQKQGFLSANVHRRSFLKFAGPGAASVALLAAGCSKNDQELPMVPGENFGSGNVAILIYAYTLEQLEAAFYTQAVATPYANISDPERGLSDRHSRS